MSVHYLRVQAEKAIAAMPPKVERTTDVIHALIKQAGFDPERVFANYDAGASLRDNISAMLGWSDEQITGYLDWKDG